MAFNRSLFRRRKRYPIGSTPFSPLSISGCVLWLDGNDPATLPNDPVDEWNDKSGNANDAFDIAGVGLPDVETWSLNSNTCVQFDPVNLGMLQINSSASLINADYSLFTVCEMLASLDGNGFYILVPETGCKPQHGYYSDLPPDYFNVTTCDTGTSAIDIQPAPQYACAFSRVESGLMDTRLNGATLLTAQATSTALGAQFYVMGGVFVTPDYIPLCNLKIAEVVMYDRAITNGEITQLETYFYSKWSLP